MKKLFVIVFGVVIMFWGFTNCSKAIHLDAQTQLLNTTPLTVADIEDMKEVKDGNLTLEFLEQMSSWKELANSELVISNSYSNIENKEDLYMVMFIELITSMENESGFIAGGIGGIERKKIDYDRFMKKIQAIIDIYNETNELQLVWKHKILGENYMQVDVDSTNVIDGKETIL